MARQYAMPTGNPSSVKYISLVTPLVVLYMLSLACREASIHDTHSAGTVVGYGYDAAERSTAEQNKEQ